MAVNITGQISTTADVPSLDILYGPYDSIEEAEAAIEVAEKTADGLTVAINTEDGLKEYWLKDGELVEKSNASGKEDKGKITIGDTEYSVRISNIDGGSEGYITFFIED